MTTISEVRESEEGAMFLICLHAISQSVFHVIACLKSILFHVSNPDVCDDVCVDVNDDVDDDVCSDV